MDFAIAPAVEDLRRRVREVIESEVRPLEDDPAAYDAHENLALDRLQVLRERLRTDGLWLPQLPPEHGGLGLGFVAMAVLYEEMGRSIFGPVAFHCAAPDDGNMMLLARVGRPEQQARWLGPLTTGRAHSAFAMTEPAPGAGSDPSMMRTAATREGDVWRVHGRKWFITGAGVAQHFVLIARTCDDPRRGLTAFLYDRDDPGWRIERRIPIIGPEEHGGHCELVFDGLVIPDVNRLMEVGDGLKVAQIRLGPARLTHCMRWLGLGRRALEIARDYVAEREGFGVRLADRESVQDKLGAAALALQQGRLLVMHAAWKLDRGDRAKPEISMAKVVVSEALHQAVDTAIQLCGARGYSRDTVLGWIYRYARQARLVDGASEVHRMVLARELAARGDAFWHWES
jgi:acyl-CoA dehydrogenase